MATSAKEDGEFEKKPWAYSLGESPKIQGKKQDDGPIKPGSPQHGSNEATSLNEEESGSWDGDQTVKTARYNYAAEKSLSHAEAKLFFQQQQLENSRQDDEAFRPPSLSGAHFAEEQGGLSPTDSIASLKSGYGYRRRENHPLSASPVTVVGLDESIIRQSTLPSDPYRTEVCISQQNRALQQNGSILLNSSVETPSPKTEGEAQPSVIDNSYVAQEMRKICTFIKNVLDIRHKYVEVSLQRPNDNPKDKENWIVYPPPPQPVWEDVNNRSDSMNSGSNSLTNFKNLAVDDHPAYTEFLGGSTAQKMLQSSAKMPRKPGQHVGEDFDLSDLLPLPEEGKTVFKLDSNSIYQVYEDVNSMQLSIPMAKVPTLRDFYKDLEYVKDVSSDGPCKSFAYRELDILEGKYNLYFLVHEYEETASCKKVPHRDFYNVRKVDTHVHHSSCMNQKHLLRFIKSKMKKSPDEVVLFRDGKRLTLEEVFASINLTAYDLSIDTLDMHVRSHDFDQLIHCFL